MAKIERIMVLVTMLVIMLLVLVLVLLESSVKQPLFYNLPVPSS